MPKLSLRAKLVAAGALALAVVAGAGFLTQRAARAQQLSQPPGVSDWKDLIYIQSSECANCHSAPRNVGDLKSTEFVLLTESSIWRTFDKHAQAYAVLEGDRGKQIGKILFGKAEAVLDAKNGCL